jgi:hypothetical protein
MSNTKWNSTYYTSMCNNIGQMKVEHADEEIKRLESQEPGSKWKREYSQFMFVIDETDDEVNNPKELIEGYCWVVRDDKEDYSETNKKLNI